MKTVRLKAPELPSNLKEHPGKSFFYNSKSFLKIWETMGGQAVYWSVFDDDENIVAVLPGIEFGFGILRRFQAMPDGLPVVVYFNDEIRVDKKKIISLLLEGIKKTGYVRMTITDYMNLCDDQNIFESQPVVVSRIDISAPDWQPPDKKIQSEIRKAEREGVEVGRFDVKKHLHEFLSLMKKTEKRHGRDPRYSPEFYRALAGLAQSDNRVRWLVVEHEGELAASHIYFTDGDTALNWQVYFDKKFSFLKPNQYILYNVAKTLAAEGVRYLNLGLSPGDAENLKVYKAKWDGSDYRYSILTARNWLGKIF